MYSKDIFKNMKCPCPVKGCDFIIKGDGLANMVLKACKHYTKKHGDLDEH